MKRLLLLVMMILIPTLGLAKTLSIGWSLPQTYEDGTPIPSWDTLSYTLYCADSGEVEYFISRDIYPEDIITTTDGEMITLIDMSFVIQGIPRDYHCVGTVFSSLADLESEFSNEIYFTVTDEDLAHLPATPILKEIRVL